jgi:hypothetical protein
MWLKSGKTYESLVGSGVNSFVTVADTGNPAFSGVPFSGSPVGNINYTYQISKYEITNKEYCLFLNSVDPFGALSGTTMVSSGLLLLLASDQPIMVNMTAVAGNRYSVSSIWENKPVIRISAYAMTMFCYWLNQGAKQYDMETLRFIRLNPSTNFVTSVPSGTDFSTLPNNFRLPNFSEWFKAAYYNGSGDYNAYATQTNVVPLAVDATSSGDGDYKLVNSLSSLRLDILKNIGIFDKNNFISNLEMDIMVFSNIAKNIYVGMNNQEVLLNNNSRECQISNINYNILLSSKKTDSQNISFGLVDILLSFASPIIVSSTFSIDTLLSSRSQMTEISMVNIDYLIADKKNYIFNEILVYDVFFNQKS